MDTRFLLNIYRIRIGAFISQIRSRVSSRRLEVSVSLFIIIGMTAGSYFLFHRGAEFLLKQGEIGSLLLHRMFYLGWSIILYLLIISNIITSFSTLYRSREISYLMTLPVTHLGIFRIRFWENLLYSSWALLILGFPLTLAYGKMQGLTPADLALVVLVGLLPFLIIATATGLLIVLVMVWLSRWFRMRVIVSMVLGFSMILLWAYFKVSQSELPVLGDVGNFRAIDRYILNLSRAPFPMIPSQWFSELVKMLASGNWRELAFYWGLLTTTALAMMEISGHVAKKLYFTTYQIMEGGGKRKERTGPAPSSLTYRRFQWIPAAVRGVVMKDTLQFIRTPQQWIQFLLFGFFIGIYLVNLSRVDIKINLMLPFWRNLVYVFNFGFSGYILAALTVRFVFPLISLEGRGFWIIRTAPFPLGRLFWEKFWMSFIVFFTLAQIVALVSNHYLQQGLAVSLLSTLFLMLMSATLISISLGLGAVYAQFHEQNPMKISSGAGGIINIVVSLFYVGLMVAALVGIIFFREQPDSGSKITLITIFVILLNTLFIYLPLKWGYRSLMQYSHNTGRD